MNLPEAPYPYRDAAYYQRYHEQDPGYQTNNWLLEEIDQILPYQTSSILELACGNGRFLERAAPSFQRVYGCDWAVSPRIEGVLAEHPNVTFFRVDLYQDLPPCQPELVVSADFLEHISPDSLPAVLQRIDSLSTMAFHKVACYDDGHSHLSIFPPARWLMLFRAVDPTYVLERVELRLGDPKREIAVFTKGRSERMPASVDQILAIVESLSREGLLEEALESLDQGLIQHPGDASLRIARGNVLLAQDRVEPSLEAIQSVIRDYPMEPLGYVNLSGLLLRLGRDEDAITAAETAYGLAPDNPDVRMLCELLQLDPGLGGKDSQESRGQAGRQPPLRLHYGCGDIRREGYVGIDIRPCAGADLCFPAWERGPFEADSADEVYSRHMFEHLNPMDAFRTLSTWHILLKKDGLIRLIVPDLRFHALQLLGRVHSWSEDPAQNLEHAMAGFYGWRDPLRGGTEHDAHRWGYTWDSLSSLLERVGYAGVTRVVTGVDSEPWHLHVVARKP